MANSDLPYREDEYITEVVAEELSDGTMVYVASHPEFEGCMAHGNTEQEARENLHEAFTLMVNHLRRYDLPIPAPAQRPVQQTVVHSFITGARVTFTLQSVVESAQLGSVSQSDIVQAPAWVRERLYIEPLVSGSISQLSPASPLRQEART